MRIAGVILAGGSSSRMGEEKAFTLLSGRPVLAHVVNRFAPQVGPLAISGNGDPARFASFSLPVFADDPGGAFGPLAGLLQGLRFAQASGCAALAAVPCDAPFLPLDLVARLMLGEGSGEVRLAEGASGPQPLFSVWPIAAIAAVADALAGGRYGVGALVQTLPHARRRFPDALPDPFFNLNRPSDLEAARLIIEPRR